MTEHDLMSKAEVRKLLKISEHTFYTYRKKYPEQFRTVLVGSRTYMRRETLDRFIQHLEQAQAEKRLTAAA